jgi:hypothetical protein
MVFSCGYVDYPTSDLQDRLREGPCEAETDSEQGGAGYLYQVHQRVWGGGLNNTPRLLLSVNVTIG